MKIRSGHLPYEKDPQGTIGAMTRAMLSDVIDDNQSPNGNLGLFMKFYTQRGEVREASNGQRISMKE